MLRLFGRRYCKCEGKILAGLKVILDEWLLLEPEFICPARIDNDSSSKSVMVKAYMNNLICSGFILIVFERK
jgi:hypothetical protein